MDSDDSGYDGSLEILGSSEGDNEFRVRTADGWGERVVFDDGVNVASLAHGGGTFRRSWNSDGQAEVWHYSAGGIGRRVSGGGSRKTKKSGGSSGDEVLAPVMLVFFLGLCALAVARLSTAPDVEPKAATQPPPSVTAAEPKDVALDLEPFLSGWLCDDESESTIDLERVTLVKGNPEAKPAYVDGYGQWGQCVDEGITLRCLLKPHRQWTAATFGEGGVWFSPKKLFCDPRRSVIRSPRYTKRKEGEEWTDDYGSWEHLGSRLQLVKSHPQWKWSQGWGEYNFKLSEQTCEEGSVLICPNGGKKCMQIAVKYAVFDEYSGFCAAAGRLTECIESSKFGDRARAALECGPQYTQEDEARERLHKALVAHIGIEDV